MQFWFILCLKASQSVTKTLCDKNVEKFISFCLKKLKILARSKHSTGEILHNWLENRRRFFPSHTAYCTILIFSLLLSHYQRLSNISCATLLNFDCSFFIFPSLSYAIIKLDNTQINFLLCLIFQLAAIKTVNFTDEKTREKSHVLAETEWLMATNLNLLLVGDNGDIGAQSVKWQLCVFLQPLFFLLKFANKSHWIVENR